MKGKSEGAIRLDRISEALWGQGFYELVTSTMMRAEFSSTPKLKMRT